MAKAEVMDLTTVCQSFPELPRPLIPRDHILNTIDDIFEGETQLVVVEGPEGSGKTTLLAQFAMRYPNHTLSLFVRPTSRWGYDPELLQSDLCNQLQWMLREEELRTGSDDALLRSQLGHLMRRAQRPRKTFYFILDGLDEVPEEEQQIRQVIMDMLPLGHPGFKFLFGGDYNELSKYIPKRVLSKPYPLSEFTLSEIRDYLNDLDIDPQIEMEISRTFRRPIMLASIRRIVQSGTDIQALLDNPSELSTLFEIEWNAVDFGNERQMCLLAILAYDRTTHTVDSIANLLQLETEEVKYLLRDLSFLQIDSTNQRVDFVSETFRKYAADQLSHLEQEVYDILIESLFNNPESAEARESLPRYLQKAGRLEELLNYLSPDHFERVLEHTQSLRPIQRQADFGLNAALELGRDGNVVQFAMHKAIMAELAQANVWHSEIEARMAVNDYDSAMGLAQSATLKEDRLHLLAIVAKAKREQGLEPEPELWEQISQLVSQIKETDIESERAIDIASDLIHVDPSLAIDLVESTSQLEQDGTALDWALAELSVAALAASKKQVQTPETTQTVDTVEEIRSRIEDPEARSFFAAASLLIQDYSADVVISEVEKLDAVGDRLFLLRLWTMKNREREDAVKVVDYALNVLIKTTEYPPSARDYREIASPLPHIQEKGKAQELVGRFDGQIETVEHLGPTEDYVRLQMLLAETEIKYNLDAARNRLIDVYFFIDELDDLAVKTECLARLAAALARIDPDEKLQIGLRETAQEELDDGIERLLNETAEQYLVTRGVIKALAKQRPQEALELALTLNTEPRRDYALLDLIRSFIELPVAKLDLNSVRQAIGHFSNTGFRDKAILEVVAKLDADSEEMESDKIREALPLINGIEQIHDAVKRCNACCLAYRFLTEQADGEYSGLASHLLTVLSRSWNSIDIGWRRVDVGFKIVSTLARSAPETAKEYLQLNQEFSGEILLDARTSALAYLSCVQLAIRAYSGLLPRNNNTQRDFDRLSSLIDFVPSKGERARLWAELALRCYTNKRLDDCRRIVMEHVRPLVESISTDDGAYRDDVIINVAPAWYCAHSLTALDQISKLPHQLRDTAYAQICYFILSKCPPADPYDMPRKHVHNLAYEEAVDICELLERMEYDSALFSIAERVTETVAFSKNRFSRQQKADIAERLERVSNKLPIQRHIQHEGYKIAMLAEIARVHQKDPQTWQKLVDSARKIPNLSDRAFVLAIIAASMLNRQAPLTKQLLEETLELIEQVPSTLDRIQRYEAVASMVVDIDPSLSRKYLRIAMESAVQSDDPSLYPIQRRIVDLAHSFDTDLAASLASLADDDPARISTREKLRDRLRILNLKKEIANKSSANEELTSSDHSYYPSAAWMLLGSLNANRRIHVHLEYLRPYLRIAASLPFSKSYPILALIIENAVRRLADTDQAATTLRSVYEATLLASELAKRTVTPSTVRLKQVKRFSIELSETPSVVVRPGDREKALRWLQDWFEYEVQDYLKICDPYFGLPDLEVLLLLRSMNPDCRVFILTSWDHQKNEKVPKPWGEHYRNYWRFRISPDLEPPETDIVVVGMQTNHKSPIHDRWWLTAGAGISVGSSFNGLGHDRTSEIATLSENEAKEREQEIDQYLYRSVREHRGERLLYELFTL